MGISLDVSMSDVAERLDPDRAKDGKQRMKKYAYSEYRQGVDRLSRQLRDVLSPYVQKGSSELDGMVAISAIGEVLAETALKTSGKERAMMVLAEVARMVGTSREK